MYVVSKYALDTIPPMTLLFIRYVIASIVMGAICWYLKVPTFLREHKQLLFQIGFIGYFISIALQFIGTKLSSAHLGALITTLSPIFLSLFAILLLKKKMNVKQVLSMCIALVGVILIVGLPNSQDKEASLWGIFALLAAALAWGYYSVISRKAFFTRACIGCFFPGKHFYYYRRISI